MEEGTLLWQPDSKAVERSKMALFASAWPVALPGLAGVARNDLNRFWELVWTECGVQGERGDGPAFVPPPAGGDLRDAEFFPGASLSLAENLLAGQRRPGAASIALVARREDGLRRTMTWQQLRGEVAALATYLAELGVGAGDRVAAWMPNSAQTLVTMLAANWLGAVFTSTSPDFGVPAVIDRFGQVAPKVLVAADGYCYGGKRIDRLPDLPDLLAGLPGTPTLLVVPELDEADRVRVRTHQLGLDAHLYEDALAAANGRPSPAEPLRQDFDAPGFVLYSSGTTGPPKCIEHRAAGVLLKHLTEHQLHCDIRPGDRVFYYTTTGWMMWNWLITVLASGATAVLYDGSPFHPGPTALWDIAEAEGLTLFGTSAKYLDACAKAGVETTTNHDLSRLRTICSTGSPLSAEGFGYVYRSIKADVHLASISGGTDLCGCFVLGDPTRPVYAGQIQGSALGMDSDVWDSDGRSLADRPGVRGELVCSTAFPSMPLGFVGDAGGRHGAKYDAAYFEGFPGVWTHGDFASRTEQGGFVIHGRSDATLNASGVRIGTAEIYREAEALPEVAEALAVGQEWDGDTRIVLFVRLSPGAELRAGLAAEIRQRLRDRCSPRHVPARIVSVPDLPRTRSGKLAELAVADVVHGRPVRNVGSLANPECLAEFEDRPELAQ